MHDGLRMRGGSELSRQQFKASRYFRDIIQTKAYLECFLAEQHRPDGRDATEWHDLFVHLGLQSPSYTSVPVPSPDTFALMAVGQTQLERAIYEIKRGANVSQLNNGYMISTRERVIKEARLATSYFLQQGCDMGWLGWDRCKNRR